MKKVALAGALAACLLSFLLWAGFLSPALAPTRADAVSGSSFAVTSYEVEMDVAANRVIEVEEKIAVRFLWEGRSGIIRDLPRDRGVRYGNFSLRRNGAEIAYSFHRDDSSLISLYLGTEGSYLSTGETYLYDLSYTMTVPALEEEGYLPLDLLGEDWQAPVSSFRAEVHLPAGLEQFEVFADAKDVTASREGNTVVVERASSQLFNGITLDLKFADGALQAPPHDGTWLRALACIGGAALLFLLIKLCFRNPLLVKTVNLSAPDKMDPLRMGKLIDTVVDKEDIGALVFYLAAEGYLTIDLHDEDDPLLEATGKPLSADAPAHIRTFYDGLFARGKQTSVSALRYSFYGTTEKVKKELAATACKPYKAGGKACVLLLGIAVALLFGLFALFWSFRTVSPFYFDWAELAASAVAYGIAAVGGYVATIRRFKWKTGAKAACRVGSFLGGCLPAALAPFSMSLGLGTAAYCLFCVGAAALGALSSLFLVRTKEYNAALEQILGFKDFLLYTEKDKISFMLKDDPELYYRILPYAQTLGITDEWTEKFGGLALDPPAWMTYDAADVLFDAWLFNSLFRTAMVGMGGSFVARPVNRGGGVSGGGFGGGFTGGGFGGGGGRSF